MLVLYYSGFKIRRGKAENFGNPAGNLIKKTLHGEIL
jgi:hypothetical protein